MVATPRDPLLIAARILIMFFIVVLGLAAVLTAFAAPAALVFQSHIIAKLAEEGVTAGGEMIIAIVVALAIVAGGLTLAVYFFVLLRRIVLSLGEGDPFIPENAVRLSRMGWAGVAVQLLLLPLGAIAVWIAQELKEVEKVHVQADFGSPNVGGILLVLILFILARVFRRGAAMRDELEGTV